MWDFDADTGLDLGSRRKPVEWVAVAPPVSERNRHNASKRSQGRKTVPRGQSEKPEESQGGGHASDEVRKSRQQQRRARRPRYDEKPPELSSGVHGRLAEAVMLEAESDEGNVEYKLRLKQPNPVRFQQLVTQLKYRLSEGNGECFYYLGVEDDGYPRGLSPPDLEMSLQTLKNMTQSVNAALQILREMPACKGRFYVIVRVCRLCQEELLYTDLRVAVAGSVDSGKSTLVAVLTHGQKGRPLLDNGHGSARMSVLKHKHEIETGRTSSLSHHTLAYDREAGVLNYAGVAPMMPTEIAAAATKVLRFVDLGGHQKYLKTAIYGMTSLLPDFLLLCICPLTGLSRVTREHFAIALALEIPLAIVLTKVDVVRSAAVDSLLQELQQLLTAASSRAARPQGLHELAGELCYTLIHSEVQAIEAARDATGEITMAQKQVPVFTLASTTGLGLPLLHSFLSHLKPTHGGGCSSSSGSPSASQCSSPLSAVSGTADRPAQAKSTEASHLIDDSSSRQLGAATEPPCPQLAVSSEGLPLEELCKGVNDNNGAPTSWPSIAESAQRRGGAVLSEQLKDPALSLGRRVSGRPGESPPGAPAHFQVDHTFEVRGVGSVVSGTLIAGEVTHNQQLLFGPTDEGDFTPVTVTSIQRSQVPVRRIRVGQHATLAIHAGTPRRAAGVDDHAAAALHEAVSAKESEEQVAVRKDNVVADSTDRRHDTWREPEQGGMAVATGQPRAAQQTDLPQPRVDAAVERRSLGSFDRGSLSGGSEQGESPRIGLVGKPTQRLSAEAALTAVHDLTIEDTSSTHAVGTTDCCQAGETAVPQLPSRCTNAAAVVNSIGGKATDDPGGGSEEDQLRPWLEHSAAQNVTSSSFIRKGTVLLDISLQPQAVWEFEAVMVLLSGFWPPRGLLSGSWPPLPDSEAEDACSDSSVTFSSPGASLERMRSPPSRSFRYKQRCDYTPVVHCGSVRQAARVVSMAEVPLSEGWDAGDASRATGCSLGPAVAAAASLLAPPTLLEGLTSSGSCVAVVTFRFAHRAEWLQEGARLVVRDRTESCTAGAGIVRFVSLGG